MFRNVWKHTSKLHTTVSWNSTNASLAPIVLISLLRLHEAEFSSRMEKKVKLSLPLLHRMTFQFSPSVRLEHIKVIFQRLCRDNLLREKRKYHRKTRKIRSALVAHITAGHCSFVFARLKNRICAGKRLTSWSRVLLEAVIVSQTVKELPAFYGTRWFITVFTACHLSWAGWIQSTKSHFCIRSTLRSYTWSLSFKLLECSYHICHGFPHSLQENTTTLPNMFTSRPSIFFRTRDLWSSSNFLCKWLMLIKPRNTDMNHWIKPVRFVGGCKG
jgi:hypothetical protein